MRQATPELPDHYYTYDPLPCGGCWDHDGEPNTATWIIHFYVDDQPADFYACDMCKASQQRYAREHADGPVLTFELRTAQRGA